MHVSNYKATFFQLHLVFLELDIHTHHLDFKILDENNNEVIRRTFYLQLLKTTRIYDNETSKIFPDLKPTAPQEPQTYRVKKLTEIETYLLNEIEVCERLAKKMKRFNTIKDIVDMDLITSTVITGGNSVAASANGLNLPVDIALRVICLLLSLAMVITRKFFKIFTVKQEKHDAIKFLAQSKLV